MVGTAFENEIYVFKIEEIHIGQEKSIINAIDDDVISINFIKSEERDSDKHCYIVFASKYELVVFSLSDEQSLHRLRLH